MKTYIVSAMMLLLAGSLAAQEKTTVSTERLKTVTGQVVDAATGQPLAGVIVAAYGETRYTAMTNEDGRYELKTPDYVTSVSMRVDGYGLIQRAIADGVANAKLFSDAFTATYKSVTTATQSAEATNFANTSAVSIDPLIHSLL